MNVFLISSALQLINALEARSYYRLPERETVLVLMPIHLRQGDAHHLKNMAAQTKWGHTFHVSARLSSTSPQKRSRLTTLQSFRSFLGEIGEISRKIGAVDHIFLGQYSDRWRRHFVNITPHNEVHVLDDGFATLTTSQMRHRVCGNPLGSIRREQIGFLKTTAERLLGARFSDLEHVSFFTAYDMQLPACDSLVLNTYSHLRSLARGMKRVENGALLGSPLVENGYISEENYVAILRIIKEKSGDVPLTYYSHRAESPDRVQRLVQRLDITHGKASFPFEWELVSGRELPSYVAGFHSSALYNCHLLFGDYMQIRAYRPDYLGIGSSCSIPAVKYDVLQSIYTFFEQHAKPEFQVVSLHPSDFLIRADA